MPKLNQHTKSPHYSALLMERLLVLILSISSAPIFVKGLNLKKEVLQAG